MLEGEAEAVQVSDALEEFKDTLKQLRINRGNNASNIVGDSMLVTVKVMGKAAKVVEDFDGSTVADLKEHIGLTGSYTANVAGDTATDDTELEEGNLVVFSPAVKGA